ncbi:MAG TPA: membrane protein insertase YidC, partial [Bauldia sp.]|nr:membrane protein insertase YidC [Bauldia sp.]
MFDNRNFILAIVLSLAVLIGWQYFVAAPQIEKAQQQAAITAAQNAATPAATPDGAPPPVADATAPPSGAAAATLTRDGALATSPRIPIETPRVSGSVNLRGARLDDLHLNDYRETVDPKSPTIVLLSPAGGPDGYFAEYGWVGGAGAPPLPTAETVWTAPEGAKLRPTTPVTLKGGNGAGLVFTR